MHIVEATIRNFKRLRLVHVEPGTGVVTIGGDNASGKSSLLDAIVVALTGGKAMPDQPVRAGEDKAEVQIRLDDGVTLHRVIKPDGTSTLRILTAEGLQPSGGAQTWLDRRIGAVSFDPMAFLAGSKPEDDRRRADVLRKLAGVDVTDLDAERTRVFAERTVVGQQERDAAGAVQTMPHWPDAPDAEVSVADLAAEVQAARDAATRKARLESEAHAAEMQARDYINAARDRGDDLVALDEDTDRDTQDVDTNAANKRSELERQIAALHERLDAIPTEVGEAKAAIFAKAAQRRRELEFRCNKANESATEQHALAEAKRAEAATIVVPDAIAMQARMVAVEDTNRHVRANAARKAAADKAAALHRDYEAKTARLDAIAQERAARIAAAQFPVQGLGFSDDGAVTFQGLPLSQASQSERIRVSMAIGLAANPTLRVVLVRDASLLDKQAMALVASMAKDAGAQVWLERVGDADEGAIVLQDGAVRG